MQARILGTLSTSNLFSSSFSSKSKMLLRSIHISPLALSSILSQTTLCQALIFSFFPSMHFLQFRRPWFNSWVRKIPWRRDRLPTPVFLGFPCSSFGKDSLCNVGDLGLIPGLGRTPGEGKGYPLQYSDLENSMDCIVHGISKSRTRLNDFHFHFSQ